MIDIRVFSRNPNFMAKKKMQTEREGSTHREQRRVRTEKKTVFYFLFFSKKKKKTNIFTCTRCCPQAKFVILGNVVRKRQTVVSNNNRKVSKSRQTKRSRKCGRKRSTPMNTYIRSNRSEEMRERSLSVLHKLILLRCIRDIPVDSRETVITTHFLNLNSVGSILCHCSLSIIVK